MNTDANPERFWRRVMVGAPDACWPFMGARLNSYGHCTIWWNGKACIAHRIAYQLATGQSLTYVGRLRPKSICVLHSCDNPACCNPSHLRLGTQRENIKEAYTKKRVRIPYRVARGEAVSTAKLTRKDVKAIRARSDRGDTQAEIAAAYGMAISTIQRIIYRQTWKHI